MHTTPWAESFAALKHLPMAIYRFSYTEEIGFTLGENDKKSQIYPSSIFIILPISCNFTEGFRTLAKLEQNLPLPPCQIPSYYVQSSPALSRTMGTTLHNRSPTKPEKGPLHIPLRQEPYRLRQSWNQLRQSCMRFQVLSWFFGRVGRLWRQTLTLWQKWALSILATVQTDFGFGSKSNVLLPHGWLAPCKDASQIQAACKLQGCGHLVYWLFGCSGIQAMKVKPTLGFLYHWKCALHADTSDMPFMVLKAKRGGKKKKKVLFLCFLASC